MIRLEYSVELELSAFLVFLNEDVSSAEDNYAGLASELIMPLGDVTLENRLFTGTQSLAGTDVGASVNGFKNYYIVVFGFENGATTPVYISEKFKPADQ